MKNMIKVLTMKMHEDKKKQCSKNVVMSVIVCISAGIMLIMNITSVILVFGFAVTGIMAGVFKKAKLLL